MKGSAVLLPKPSDGSVEANGVAQGSGEPERLRNGSAKGFSSKACREGLSKSSKPSMVRNKAASPKF